MERSAAGGFGRFDIHEVFLGLGGIGVGVGEAAAHLKSGGREGSD
jgi:hypothetical protein